MVDHIWWIFIIIGITYSFITGNIHEINTEIINAGTDSINLILSLLPLLIIWMGLMQIAEKSGLIQKIAKLMTP